MKIQHTIVFLVAVFYGAGLSAMDVEGASFEACEHILNAADSTEAQNTALASIGRVHLFCKEQIKESIRDFLNARYSDGLPEYGRVALRSIDEAHRMRRELSVSHVSHGEEYGFALCIHGWAAAGHLYLV